MGRIRSVQIKSTALKLLEGHKDEFGKEFEKNKQALDRLTITESKKIRNRLAGYIAHIVQKEEKLHTLKVSYQPVVDNRRKRKRRRR